MKKNETSTVRISLDDLTDFFDLFPGVPEFLEGCDQAAEVGRQLRLMREVREQHEAADGSSFASYLKQLAEWAGLRIATWRTLMEWYGAGSIHDTLRNPDRVARLAKALGMPRVETTARVKLGLAEAIGELAPALGRTGRGGHAPTLQESMRAIAHVRWPSDLDQALKRFEVNLEAAYDE